MTQDASPGGESGLSDRTDRLSPGFHLVVLPGCQQCAELQRPCGELQQQAAIEMCGVSRY
jgi:hypothetical protein